MASSSSSGNKDLNEKSRGLPSWMASVNPGETQAKSNKNDESPICNIFNQSSSSPTKKSSNKKSYHYLMSPSELHNLAKNNLDVKK